MIENDNAYFFSNMNIGIYIATLILNLWQHLSRTQRESIKGRNDQNNWNKSHKKQYEW